MVAIFVDAWKDMSYRMRQSVLVSFQYLSILPYEIYCTCISFKLDIDECNEGTDLCDTNANCINNNGSYVCMCNSGYEGSGLTCRSKLCGHCMKTTYASINTHTCLLCMHILLLHRCK